jgi:hypothetical protein
MDIFNVIVGAISIIAFGFAIFEHRARRKVEVLQESRLQLYEEHNNAALRSAVVAAQSADLMVQRSKEADVTVAELRTLARGLRGVMMTLASELEEQSALMKKWKFGKRMTQSEALVQSGQTS